MNCIHVPCFFFLALSTDTSDIHQPSASELLSSISDLSLGLPQSQTESFLRCRKEHLWGSILLFLQVWTRLFFCLPLPQQAGWAKLPQPYPGLPRPIPSTTDRLQGLEMTYYAVKKKDGDDMEIHRTSHRQLPPPTVLVLDKIPGQSVMLIFVSIYLPRLSTIHPKRNSSSYHLRNTSLF